MAEIGAPGATDILSIWSSPLDKVALVKANALADHQPLCTIVPNEDLHLMTIYNYQYYVTATGGNESGLSAMFSAMNPNYLGYVGGVAFIRQGAPPLPYQPYTISIPATGPFEVPDQCNIVAAGTGGSDSTFDFYHFIVTPSGGPTFLSCSASAYTTGGTYFHGIAFNFTSWTGPQDNCILANAGNCTAIRCTFVDCPLAFYAKGPGCTLKQCTIVYEKNAPSNAIAVRLASSQCAVLGPGDLEQWPVHPGMGGGGPISCTCISIEGGADHTVIADTHISDWTTGIDFSNGGGSTNSQIRNCEIQSYYTSVNIAVGSDGAAISGVKVTGCLLSRGNYSGDSGKSNPVVNINPGAPGNNAISDVTLLGCTVYNMGDASTLTGQHGLQIVGGTNIKVLGGTYSNNSPAFGAGIAITGPCGDIQIIGVNLMPSYANGTGISTTQCQAYGLLVTSNPAPNMTILVRDCDMRGYSPSTGCGTAPVSTSSVTSGLYINDCLGYNDQNTPLTTASLTSPSMAATCSTPYFGPSVITFTNPTPVTLNINGQTASLSFGVVFLASPYDSFFFSTAPHGFTWYGK